MKGNDILDVCRRLNQIADELAAMVDEKIRHGEDGETDDNVEEGGTFWMMSASKQVKLVGTAQSLIAGITDALRTATVDHSKVFEVMALLSAVGESREPDKEAWWERVRGTGGKRGVVHPIRRNRLAESWQSCRGATN